MAYAKGYRYLLAEADRQAKTLGLSRKNAETVYLDDATEMNWYENGRKINSIKIRFERVPTSIKVNGVEVDY